MVTLTEVGADYLARIEPILAALDEADQAARGTGELRGILRVGVSSSFAVRELVPRLPAFMADHPALRVELLINDQRQDLVSEGVDVALRFGKLADSTAIARRLGAIGCVLVASPAYLNKHGMPESPADIADRASTPAASADDRPLPGRSSPRSWSRLGPGARASGREQRGNP
jgi:DNA-binding transcriptional LysR family regulator